MEFHPHIHSIVTGGGIKNNKWVQTDKDYLMKVQVLSSLFKGKFLSMLKSIDLKLPEHLKHSGLITFEYKDYNDNSSRKEMTIPAEEFIRRNQNKYNTFPLHDFLLEIIVQCSYKTFCLCKNFHNLLYIVT